MDGRIVDEGEGVVVDTLIGIEDGEVDDGFREYGNIDFCGVGTLSLVVVNEKCYGISSGLSIAMLRLKAVIDRGSITEIPFVLSVTCYGIIGEILEDKEIVVETLRGIID